MSSLSNLISSESIFSFKNFFPILLEIDWFDSQWNWQIPVNFDGSSKWKSNLVKWKNSWFNSREYCKFLKRFIFGCRKEAVKKWDYIINEWTYICFQLYKLFLLQIAQEEKSFNEEFQYLYKTFRNFWVDLSSFELSSPSKLW